MESAVNLEMLKTFFSNTNKKNGMETGLIIWLYNDET